MLLHGANKFITLNKVQTTDKINLVVKGTVKIKSVKNKNMNLQNLHFFNFIKLKIEIRL